MATKPSTLLRRASTLLRAARKESLRSRVLAAAASRSAAAAASQAVRAAGVGASVARAVRLSLEPRCSPKSSSSSRFPTIDDYEHLPEDSKTPTDKDFESDEAVWALYERWCKAFGVKRDHAEMVRRFRVFRYHAEQVHRWNTYVPAHPKKAANCLRKRRQAKLLISKGEDVSHFDERHLPVILGPEADGGDPFLEYLWKDVYQKDGSTPCS